MQGTLSVGLVLFGPEHEIIRIYINSEAVSNSALTLLAI